MIKTGLFTLLAALFLFVGGCSAGGGAETSSYRGAYRAAYTIPQLNENGTFSFSVAQKGGMTGSLTDVRTTAVRAFDGKIDSKGNFSGTLSGAQGGTGGATPLSQAGGTMSGLLSTTTGSGSSSAGGVAGGDFRTTINGVEYQGNFTVVAGGAVSLPTFDSTYRGSYSGQWSLLGQHQAGTAAYSIDQTGAVAGALLSTGSNGAQSLQSLTGTVDNNGRFVGTLNGPTGAATVSGTLDKTTGGIASGTLHQVINGADVLLTFSASPPLADKSPYVGAFRGTYSVPGAGFSGIASYSVDGKGSVTGSLLNNGQTGLLSGQVDNSGALNATITFPVAAYSIRGVLGVSSDGSPKGDFSLTVGGTSYPGSFGPPVSTSSGAPSPYAGSFRGTFSVPTLGDSGTVSLTIDRDGGAVGSWVGVETASFVATVSPNGTFAGTLTYPNGFRAVTGKLASTTAINPTGGGTLAALSGDMVLTANGQNYIGTLSLTAAVVSPPSSGTSPYEGAYKGAFDNPVLGQHGTLVFTVDSQGAVLGTVARTDSANASQNPSGTLTGVVSGSGVLTGQIVYPPSSTGDGTSAGETRLITGVVQKQASGSGTGGLSGEWREPIAGFDYVVNFDTTRR